MNKIKLALLVVLLPLFAIGQTTPAQDTTLITPSTAVTPQYRYSYIGGNMVLQSYINGKYYYFPTNKMIRNLFVDKSTNQTIAGEKTFTNYLQINGGSQFNSQANFLGNVTIGASGQPGMFIYADGSQTIRFDAVSPKDLKFDPTIGRLKFGPANSANETLAYVSEITGAGGLTYSKAQIDSIANLRATNFASFKEVWVDTLGNNATALIGRKDKPFATLAGAITATTGRTIIHIGVGRFVTPGVLPRSNISLLGSGKPVPNWTLSYTALSLSSPVITYTAPTKLIGGTVIVGELIDTLHNNIKIKDLGVDCGKEWKDAGGSPTVGSLAIYAGQAQAAQSANPQKYGIEVENVAALSYTANNGQHAFLFENMYGFKGRNLSSYFGAHGLAYKGSYGTIDGFDGHGHTSDAFITKGDVYAYNYNNTFSNIAITSIASGDGAGINVGSVNSVIYNNSFNNVNFDGTTFGFNIGGTSGGYVNGLQISNVAARNVSGYALVLADTLTRNLNVNGLLGVKTAGVFARFGNLSGANNLNAINLINTVGTAYDIQTPSSISPSNVTLTNSSASGSTTKDYGFSGSVSGNGNWFQTPSVTNTGVYYTNNTKAPINALSDLSRFGVSTEKVWLGSNAFSFNRNLGTGVQDVTTTSSLQWQHSANTTPGTDNFAYQIRNTTIGLLNRAYWNGNGNFGFEANQNDSKFKLGVGTTTYSSLNIPAGVAKTTPVDGDIYKGATRLFIQDGGVSNTIAYLSDIVGRGRVVMSANITGILNYDYLNNTANTYNFTVPATTGFSTDGSSIITGLVIGTGKIRIFAPSGYTIQTPSGFITPVTGYAEVIQNQKYQLIPVGTNAYYLQPLNGSITIVP